MTPLEVESRLASLRSMLDSAGCAYEILSHERTLHSAEDGVAHGMGSLEEMAPTFILKGDGSFFAAIVSGATKLSYRKLRKSLGLSNVSLADPHTVLDLTGSVVGTVSLVQTALPTLVDERLTTADAQRRLSSQGIRGRRQRTVVDQAAAVLILQSWLDTNRSRA